MQVCVTCGAEYPSPSTSCKICEDERQYVAKGGQKWIDKEDLLKQHKNKLQDEEPGLLGIGTDPPFAIGQRSLLLQTDDGNLLWDCINVLTEGTKDQVHKLGGIKAIAISHPHFYTGMATWAAEFGATIYVHELDKEWVTNPSEHIQYWTGDKVELFGGLTLLRLGGHFPGSAVLHWSKGCEGRGILCTGDTIQATPGEGWVSFMYSYPMMIPLPAAQVARIRDTVQNWPYQFEHLYGGWFGKAVGADAKAVVLRSADRYMGVLDGSLQKRYF
ncbi:g6135 [Coccomyxa elongata]